MEGGDGIDRTLRSPTDEARVAFRRLRRDDFALLGRWLAAPHVARWWVHETDPDAIERDFGPGVDGTDPGQDHVVLLDGRPVGLIQYCRFRDFPEYVEQMEPVYPVGDATVSIDYFVGDLDEIGHGVGSTMIRAFVRRVWATDPWATDVVVPVNSLNTASWGALLKAGFRLVARGDLEPDNPIDPPGHEVLRIDRPRLILLNGAPASGKSTLAERFVDAHPLTLDLDIDELRGRLGRWRDHPDRAGRLARELALTIARRHLRNGHDVIVPQFLGRTEFVEQLAEAADDAHAVFVELALMLPRDAAIAAFEERRASVDRRHRDAAALVDASTEIDAVGSMYDAFVRTVDARPASRRIAVEPGDIDATLRSVERALEESRRR